jgi:hypothetical protein
MRKSIRLLTIAAAATVAFASCAASAQNRPTQSARAAGTLAISPRVGAAHAETNMPAVSSMAQDYANAMHMNLGSGPLCRPGGRIMLADGLHACQ